MGFLKKNWLFLLGLALIGLYVVTRLYNILALPIFTDEAIYARWSQIAANDAAWRFISLTDGKQPMYVWIAMLVMKLVDDPLLASRLVSVLSGFGSLIGIFFLTREIFKNKQIAVLASLIYVLYPFSLVYDRMALYDSLVAMFIIWALFFEILMVRYLRLDLALLLGMIIGAGMLTKTNANFAFILLPALLLFVDYKKKDWKKIVAKLLGFSLVALVVANAMYAILRLSPFFHIIADKNLVFIYSPQEFLSHPFTYFIPNLRVLFEWLFIYATVPFLLLVLAAFFVGKKYFKEKLLLLIWFLVPLLISALFFKQFYPRHILFMTMPLLVLGAYGLYYMIGFVKKLWLKAIVIVVFLTMFVINDYFIITDFSKATVPLSDKGQYISGWPSGVGVKETVAFLKEKSQTEKIYVATEGTFGLMPYALELYFYNNPNVKIVGYWPISDTPPKEVIEASKQMPTYFVFYQECTACQGKGLAPKQWKVESAMQIEKLEPNSYYTLYKVIAQ